MSNVFQKLYRKWLDRKPKVNYKKLSDYVLEENFKLKCRVETLTQEKSVLEHNIEEMNKETEIQFGCYEEQIKVKCKISKAEGTKESVDYLLKLLHLNMDSLRKSESNFDVYEDSDGRWAVVTHYCNLGGCDMPTYFTTEHSARIYALMMTYSGAKPISDGACQDCYSEYMTDCM
ncbi:MAG: hypothetical protein IJ341_02180 [Bacteroidales bacterium]|nr:hypothetical protein [Bacteroidales bacterium]